MENKALNQIEQINSVFNQIRDVLKGTSEANVGCVSRVNELLIECSTNWERYRECIRAMDVARQNLFRSKAVKNWNGVEMSVFTWETQFQKIFSSLEESARLCENESDGYSNNQSLDALRTLAEKLLGEKAAERVQRRRKIGFSDAVRICLKKYMYYEGRATRSEYWYFVLFYYLVLIASALVAVLGSALSEEFANAILLFVLPVWLGLVPPFISVFVRRLHDIGKSGWWYWLGFIPFGDIVLLIFCCTPSEERDNEYGPYIP